MLHDLEPSRFRLYYLVVVRGKGDERLSTEVTLEYSNGYYDYYLHPHRFTEDSPVTNVVELDESRSL